MTRRSTRLAALLPLAVVGLAASPYVPWEDLTEADFVYSLATRFADVDGRKVHYPTPTAELAQALQARSEPLALRHLAEARLALGDRAGAVDALTRWAEAEGAPAWDEAARWLAQHHEWAAAFRAVERALPGLAATAQRALIDQAVTWADAHPEAADRLAWRARRASLQPADAEALEDWITALQQAGKLDEALAALDRSPALPAETRLLIRTDLLAEGGQRRRAFELLDASLGDGSGALPSPAALAAFRVRVDEGAPTAPETWRGALERAFDARALVRLASYFQGQGRGDAAADLLRQVERRHEAGLDRAGLLLVSRLWAQIDSIPEAFRARLTAAQAGGPDEQAGDLAELARLALRAGGRPLAWGTYNDEPYRWAAPLDRTPGFWTGGLSFLLTGQDWREALAHLEAETLPERTFRTALALAEELKRRAPSHPELPALRAALMARHVERGEGREALLLLPLVEAGPPEVAAEGRRTALLAMRQVEVPLHDEARLYRDQLRAAAPDGSRPSFEHTYEPWGDAADARGFDRRRFAGAGQSYRNLLDEAVARLDSRDPGHRAALDLLLHELDRLPDCEELWTHVAERLEGWRLDGELGPRYERALARFDSAAWWDRAARHYLRRKRQAELKALAEDLAARFRGSALFERADNRDLSLDLPAEAGAAERLRLVPWADYVRLRALQRFPHSPRVFNEALGRLVTREEAARGATGGVGKGRQPVLVEAALLDERRAALLFVDPARRGAYLDALVEQGQLEARLASWEQTAARTPVEERLLLDALTRLSLFERAVAPASRLAAAYPGDGALAREALTLHRSLGTLEPGHAAPARTLVERTAPALEDPNPLWTELGELEQERGRPDLAQQTWRRLLEREPRNPKRAEELATLLWDYGFMREGLQVIEDARTRLDSPRLLAFEAGVLREELKDLPGAVREYLVAAQPDGRDCFCTWYEADQRALRRLSQLLARERPRALVVQAIAALRPGQRADEQRLVALFPLAQIGMPDDTLDFTADDWIDEQDLPHDPVGREQRLRARADWRPRAREGFTAIGAALLERAFAMLPRGSEPAFLDALSEWQLRLLDPRWGAGREVDFEDALRARRAALAPSEEDRVALEVERARFLFERGRLAAADALWASLNARVTALPQGAPRLRAEAERAGYLERSRGAEAAAAEWQAIGQRYPWSRGLLDARLEFLARHGRQAEGRRLLEQAAPRAAAGHREDLLARLAREAIAGADLAQARRAVEALLAVPDLAPGARLGAVHLLARLALRENAAVDLVALAKAQEPRLDGEQRPDVWAQAAAAADAEKQWAGALTLWIEALNRRLDRPWIRSAWRSAERASRTEALRGFFETQRERSPRDVRWAVAVRELRLLANDLEGAIQMSRAAVDVRPERESLWSETVDLLVRAGRPAEAADYLAGWAKPRPADEGVASWRSRLYVEADLPAKALQVEQEALAAYAQEAPGDEQEEARDERHSRAVRRLMEHGLPREALLLATGGDVRKLDQITLGWDACAELSLSNDKLGTFLRAFGSQSEARDAMAQVIAARGRPEHEQEALDYVLRQVAPAVATPKTAAPWGLDGRALGTWWDFVTNAGLETELRAALARRALLAVPGPWAVSPPRALIERAGESLVRFDAAGRAAGLQPVDVDALWVRHLVTRDDLDGLGAFVQPRLLELVTQATGQGALASTCRKARPSNWTRWLDPPEALQAFLRWARARPEGVGALEPLFRERRAWDRAWALGACGWNTTPIVAALPEDARAAWFRMWLDPSPQDKDPVRRARGETLDMLGTALARLASGAPGAADDDLITRLRGPRTVGDVLDSDPRWTWPEFTPREGTPDDRVVGRGADAGRFPGALWGERPGTAYYVLETLARWRAGDASAARVPLEVPERGREGLRAALAEELAERLGDHDFALALQSDYPAGASDLPRLRAQLERVRRGRGAEAAQATLVAELRRLQPSLTEATFRGLAWLAEDLGLSATVDALDPARPLGSSLLAYLCERHGVAVAARFRAQDPAEFRSALASRWGAHAGRLPAEAVRYWLDELWVHGAATLPRAGLRRLGDAWPAWADWLDSVHLADRAEALQALRALPDAARIEALLARASNPRADVVRQMRARLHLARGDEAGALALLDEVLAELRGDVPLSLQVVAVADVPLDEEEGAFEGEEHDSDAGAWRARAEAESDPASARLRSWLGPFREARREAAAVLRVRALLRERREAHVSTPLAQAWRLEFELAPAGAERDALASALEHAWVRGDVSRWQLTPFVETLARLLPAEARRFVPRLPRDAGFDNASEIARLLARAQDERGAAAWLIARRAGGRFQASEEVRAFDQWRRLSVAGSTDATGPRPPASWSAALPFWKRPPGEATAALLAHLRQKPFDVLAARAALRTIAPADNETTTVVAAALAHGENGADHDDLQFLRVRAARADLARSWRAARGDDLPRGDWLAAELERRRLRAADIDATLHDLARIATPAGDAGGADAALHALDLRQPAAAAKLRAELRGQRPSAPLRPFHLAPNGAIEALRPRTLDWPLLQAALAQEATR